MCSCPGCYGGYFVRTRERVNTGNSKLSAWAGQRLVGVDGSPLQVFGQAEVQVMLGDTQFPINVLAVSPLTTGAILGLDFLQQSNATIDLRVRELHIGSGQGTRVPLVIDFIDYVT